MRLFVLYTFFQNEHSLEMKQVVFLYWDWTAYYIILLFPAIKMRPPCQFSILILNCILQRDMNHVPKECSVVSKYILCSTYSILLHCLPFSQRISLDFILLYMTNGHLIYSTVLHSLWWTSSGKRKLLFIMYPCFYPLVNYPVMTSFTLI
jgi:hypothetical protein